MESFIGKNVLDRLQTNILKMIKNGQLDPMIVKLLSRSEPFDDANIKYDLPIPLDDDPVNKQKRINLYERYRQLLLRAAKMKAAGLEAWDKEFKD